MAQQPANILGDQPNFHTMRDLAAAFGDEIVKCENIPGFDGGHAILVAINAIATRVDALATQVDALATRVDALATRVDDGFTGFNQRLTALDQKVDAGFAELKNVQHAERANAIARGVNASATRESSRLMPLVSINNQPIPNFPATPDAIKHLSAAEATDILNALSVDNRGTAIQKRERLLLHCGVILQLQVQVS